MRIKNSMNNIMTGLIGQIIVLLTGFVSRTVFIKVLGSTYLGVSGLFSNILTVLSFAELGIGQAIIFSLYKPIAVKDENKICSLMQLYARVYRILFFIVLGLGLAILPFLGYIIKDINEIPNIRIIYVMYVINSAMSYLFAYKGTFITACQKNYLLNIINFIANILMTIIQIIGLFVFKNYLVYLGIQIGFGILQNMFTYFYADKLFPFLKRKDVTPLPTEEKNKIKKNVGALILYKIGTLALNSTDNIIISAYVGIVTVGLYSNYLLLSTSVTGFLSTIFGNLTASIGNLNANDDVEKKYFIFRTINLATFWFYALCAICLYICMTPFINIWIGSEYILPDSVSLIISINVYIAGMLYAPFNYRQTMGLFVEGKMRPIISAIINIVVSIAFVKVWGLAGVLWGTAVARLSTNVWFDPYLVYKKGLGVSPVKYMTDYLIKFIIFVGTGFLCVCISGMIQSGNIIYVALKGVTAFIMCNIVFLAIYYRSEEFKYLLDIVKNMKSIMRNK
jgi:O-antigen/teichoic acid export membrane protein